jgi:hypothetical protein
VIRPHATGFFVVAALLLTVACGSTVHNGAALSGGQDSSTTGARAAGSNGLGGSTNGNRSVPSGSGTAGSSGPQGGRSQSLGTAQNGGAANSSTTDQTSGSAPVGAGGSSGTGSAATAPGVTATSITVGITYATNTQADGAAFGITGVNVGDPLAEQKAIINDINAHGGVGGRRLLYVAHPIDATSTDNYDAQAEAECADFTQDHKVFAVLHDWSNDDLRACLNKAGVAQITEGLQSVFTTPATYRNFPYFLTPANISLDRVDANWVPALTGQHYFDKWNTATGAPGGAMPVKVGILDVDNAASRLAVSGNLEPALKAGGIPYEVIRVNDPQSQGDSGNVVAQIQSAVLKFRNDNVTHFLPTQSGIVTYFAKNASSQKYYPRYGLNSNDSTEVLLEAGLVPKDEMNGAVGYGWSPLLDVSRASDPDNGPNSNAARRSCITLMKRAGINITGAPATRGALEYCDVYNFLKRTVEAGGPTVNRGSFLAGANAQARSFVAATTFTTFLDPTHHDGVAAARNFAYVSSCGCLQYKGPVGTLR